jgi:hypothetical protein
MTETPDEPIARDADEIMRALPLRHGDVVIVSGSLVEGIGNATSDYDVVVVCGDNGAARDGRPPYVDGVASGRRFGADVYHVDDLRAMSRTLSEAYKRALEPAVTFEPQLPQCVQECIHKVVVGRLFGDFAARARIIELFVPAHFNFVKYRQSVRGFEEFLDIIGAWRSTDYDTALHLCREYLVRQAMGLVHLAGNTNFKRKWLLRNLARLDGIARAPASALAAWLHADRANRRARADGVVDACRVMDDIFTAIRDLLDSNASYCPTLRFLTWIEEEFSARPRDDALTRQEYEYWRRMYSAAAPPLTNHLDL